MITVDLAGREWIFHAPGFSVAEALYDLGKSSGDAGRVVWGLVAEFMDDDSWIAMQSLLSEPENELESSGGVIELFYRWLEEATGKPFNAVAALSQGLIQNWGKVQGRLVLAGIPDPKAMVPYPALLDALDMMIREGHKDEKETRRYESQVFKPRVKNGTISKPKGFEEDDMAAQAAMLDALG